MSFTIHPYAIANGVHVDFDVVVQPKSLDPLWNLNWPTKQTAYGTTVARKLTHGDKQSYLFFKNEIVFKQDAPEIMEKDCAGRPISMDYGFIVDDLAQAEAILKDDGVLNKLLAETKQYVQPHVYANLPDYRPQPMVYSEPLVIEALPNGKHPDYVTRLEDFSLDDKLKKLEALKQEAKAKRDGKTEPEVNETPSAEIEHTIKKKTKPTDGAGSNSPKGGVNSSEKPMSFHEENFPTKKTDLPHSASLGKIVGTTVLAIIFGDGIRRITQSANKNPDDAKEKKNRMIGTIEALAATLGIVLVWKYEPIRLFVTSSFKGRNS